MFDTAVATGMGQPGGGRPIYVIMDELILSHPFVYNNNFDKLKHRKASGVIVVGSDTISDFDPSDEDVDVSSSFMLSDVQILQCALSSTKKRDDDLGAPFRYLYAETPAIFGSELKDVDRQANILSKGLLFVGIRTVNTCHSNHKLFEERRASERCERTIWVNTKRTRKIRRNHEHVARREAGNYNVEKEKHRSFNYHSLALSLLCVKKFSGSGTMLEAPPGSREDLVEAARTPCTPTDLDTMLYGYTNNIYVLDHTPESLPDMDMLQLFASPAGRALLTSDNRPRRSTSTSSLSRESSSRLKSGRRPSGSGIVSAPTSPPRQRKSSAELYKEAVEILGLTCSLTDSCRCIDCQSNYFDCDDDCGDARTELAAGTPILLDHALSHPLTCSIQ